MPLNPNLIKMMSAMHLFWYRLTGGVIGGSLAGRPILLLTTTGRKSGRRRTTPLQYMEDGGDMVLVASNGGNPRHPVWWLNLERNPEAEVQVRNEKRRVTAEKAEGEERERLWGLVVEMYSGYEGYQRTTNREIPVVVLRPR
ncbi:MAG: nitroreductase family deazaflavin-dependent oxidoreductase [Chloroflexi bacterium]|nr:nitroreductase family deazaflavin-dependent oxidoreductase [Chloroflexota bacterium]